MGCYMLTEAQRAQLQQDLKLFFFHPYLMSQCDLTSLDKSQQNRLINYFNLLFFSVFSIFCVSSLAATAQKTKNLSV